MTGKGRCTLFKRHSSISYYTPFNQAAAQPSTIPPAETEPRRDHHDLEAGVFVPGLQTIITGAFAFLAMLCISLLLRWRQPLAWAGVAMVFTMAVMWGALLWRWLRLTDKLEALTQLDLNGDGYIPDIIRVAVTSQDQKSTILATVPHASKLPILARGVLGGMPFSEREWTGRFKPLSQTEFRRIRDVFVSRGLARWTDDDHRQGIVLTPAGISVLKAISKNNLSPSQVVDVGREW
jgi:hypothetical protein